MDYEEAAEKMRQLAADPKQARRAATVGELAAVLETVLVLRGALKWAQQKIKELEKFPFEYLGAHEQGKAYRKNSVVSHAGGMWVAKTETTQRPGDGPTWQLAVKAGRDAR